MPLVPMPGTASNDLLSTGSEARPGKWLAFESSRVSEGRYDGGLEQVHVIFKDGTPWTYNGVPRNIWRNFRRSASPGRYINRVLNGYPYWRGGFSYGEEEPATGAETSPAMRARVQEEITQMVREEW